LVIFEDKTIKDHINKKVSSRALHIDMVIHKSIFKTNQITVFPRFTFILKTGASFYCAQTGCPEIRENQGIVREFYFLENIRENSGNSATEIFQKKKLIAINKQ